MHSDEVDTRKVNLVNTQGTFGVGRGPGSIPDDAPSETVKVQGLSGSGFEARLNKLIGVV